MLGTALLQAACRDRDRSRRWEHERALRAPRQPRCRAGDPARGGGLARHRPGALHRRPRRSAPTASCTPTRCRRRTPTPGSPGSTPLRRSTCPAWSGCSPPTTCPGSTTPGIKHDEPLFPSEVMFYGHAVVLGARRDARGGPARCRWPSRSTTSRCRRWSTSARPSSADSFQGGQPHMERGDIDAGFDGAAHVFSGEFEFAGQEHFYLETHCLARPGRRERPDLRPEQHPAPDRDAGHRRPRPRHAEPRRHRPVPADGRRLRWQGDAAPRLRRHRRPRRHPHRPPGAAAPQPDPGHDDVRQAARLPRAVAGRLRRRRAVCRPSTRP